MLDAGADMKVIQARLGHTKYETTANLYAHLLQGAQADATSKLDEMMARKKPKKSWWAHFVGTLQKQKKPVSPTEAVKNWLF